MMMNAAAQGKQLMEHLGALHGSGYAKEFHKGMCGAGWISDLGHGLSDVAHMFGLGKKKHQKKHDSDSESDEERGGLHTGQYEGEGHCGGVAFSRDTQDFSGHMKGGFWGLAALALPLISKLLGSGKMSQEAHDQVKKMIDLHEQKFHSGKMKGGFWGLAAMALPLISKLLGSGQMTKSAHDQLEKIIKKSDKEMKGGFAFGNFGLKKPHWSDYIAPVRDSFVPAVAKVAETLIPLVGKGRVVGGAKRVVGAGDGRRKRAEVVRKVMAEKGMKMIEASKYVKEHGLYKP